MLLLSRVFPNTYQDSIMLMRIAKSLREAPGVGIAEVVMGTRTNMEVLAASGLISEEVRQAGPNDLIVSLLARDGKRGEDALRRAQELLKRTGSGEVSGDETVSGAVEKLPGANMALISVPGSHVRRLALEALQAGLNLMVFSDNVPLEDELAIKENAARKNLLVMGPDCGTAIIAGKVLGFGNRVRGGSIGLVGASGTGIQQVSVLIHARGGGISHAIGTGSNDVSDAIGGRSLIQGLRMLAADPRTAVIVVVSKPPGAGTLRAVLKEIGGIGKPAVLNFIGARAEAFRNRESAGVRFTTTFEETAARAFAFTTLSGPAAGDGTRVDPEMLGLVDAEKMKLAESQKFLRGLYTGGSLALEAGVILRSPRLRLNGNIHLAGMELLPDPMASAGHSIIDLGADEFTMGKPHPMIEPSLRAERIVQEAHDPEAAVILLDFMLGYGAHNDPAGETAAYLDEARRIAASGGRHLILIASVCGTDRDPQHLGGQIERLRRHGVLVLPSSTQAAAACRHVIDAG